MGKGAVASTEERLIGPEPALSWHQPPRAEPGDEGKKKQEVLSKRHLLGLLGPPTSVTPPGQR